MKLAIKCSNVLDRRRIIVALELFGCSSTYSTTTRNELMLMGNQYDSPFIPYVTVLLVDKRNTLERSFHWQVERTSDIDKSDAILDLYDITN